MSGTSSQQSHQQPPQRAYPSVIIVGAGLGGLMLGALLEQINIPYHIFERAAEVRPLGSAMTLGPNLMPIFEQLGLVEEIRKFSLPCLGLDVYNESMKHLGTIDLKSHKALAGHEHLLFARPLLYELMRKQVPASKITMGKKVLRTEEKEDRVVIHCSDNTTYEADILIGADGAYSGVRQSLYKQMDAQGILPKVDLENFSIGYVTMVGVANPQDPEKFPQLKDSVSHFTSVMGEGSKNWTIVNVPNNQICWAMSVQLGDSKLKGQQFRNSEWGPEANESMIKEFQDFPTPWGGKMGDIIEATPKHLISKVFLEEKVFKTWYHGRIALLGDAAHKMLPSAGQGAVNAMQDAIVMANCLYNMSNCSVASIRAAFEDYYSQRYHRANEQFERSKSLGKVMLGQTWSDRVVRHAIFNYTPDWVVQRGFAKSFEYRPQAAWLPLAENKGTGKVLPQECKRWEINDKEKQVEQAQQQARQQVQQV
ncbi:hypothetical protein BX616_005105 [Lobosporangium transversale]|nr:hypothetical protein BX616_005105 [Lobosporangium transversale]